MTEDISLEIVQTAAQLQASARYRECSDLLEGALRDGLDTADLHKLLAEAYFAQSRFSEAMPSFQRCLSEMGHNCPFGFYEMAVAASRIAYSDTKERLAFWNAASHPVSVTLEETIRHILAREFDLARHSFAEAGSQIFTDVSVLEIWQETLELIIKWEDDHSIDFEVSASRIRKILVSGYGWSGSGAMYDYFSEFDDVLALSVEAPHLKSASGFLSLMNSADDIPRFKENAYLFFTRMLIGRGNLFDERAFGDYIRVSQVRWRQKQKTYAQNARDVIALVLSVIGKASHRGNVSRDELSLIADQIVNKIMIGDKAPASDMTVLLDNIIHVNDALLATHLRDTTMICSFRDARSNFVSIKKELPTFLDSGRQFARSRISWMREVLAGYAEAEAIAPQLDSFTLTRVSFEIFVLSEKTRTELVDLAGIGKSGHRKFEHFRPWESLRNVIVHQEWENPQDIREIETIIPEQCFDLEIVPFGAGVLRQG